MERNFVPASNTPHELGVGHHAFDRPVLGSCMGEKELYGNFGRLPVVDIFVPIGRRHRGSSGKDGRTAHLKFIPGLELAVRKLTKRSK